MRIRSTVHSVAEESVAVPARLADGTEVEALRPRLVVELVSDEHGHVFRLPPASGDELAAQRALFAPGAAIDLTFAPAADA